jgi:TRAP-type C4-dicarboxylate transport system substrate-binding protein
MVKKAIRISLIVLALFIFLGVCSVQAADVIKWRFASNHVRGLSFCEATYPHFVQSIKEMSGGRMEVEIVYDGEGIEQAQVFDSIQAGLAQMGDPSISMGSKVPFAEVEIGLPASPSIIEMLALDHFAGWNGILGEAYGKLGTVKLGSAHYGGIYLLSKKPINSISDFKNLKVRAFEPIASYLSELGASPVNIAFSEVYTSLATGVVDAATTTMLDHEDAKFFEVAKYIYPVPLTGNLTMPILANQKAFNELPTDLQAILKAAVIQHELRLAIFTSMSEKESLQRMVAKGVTISPAPSDAESKEFQKAGLKIWAKYDDEVSKKLLGAMEKYLNDIR